MSPRRGGKFCRHLASCESFADFPPSDGIRPSEMSPKKERKIFFLLRIKTRGRKKYISSKLGLPFSPNPPLYPLPKWKGKKIKSTVLSTGTMVEWKLSRGSCVPLVWPSAITTADLLSLLHPVPLHLWVDHSHSVHVSLSLLNERAYIPTKKMIRPWWFILMEECFYVSYTCGHSERCSDSPPEQEVKKIVAITTQPFIGAWLHTCLG